jgi:hypothetical protein
MKSESMSYLYDEHKSIKNAIWLYLVLIIFEGAIRKWILPELSNIILIIRDPLALFIILEANRKNLIISNRILISMISIGILSFITTFFSGHADFLVALFGLRIFILHIPLIFIIGNVLNKEDTIKIGKFFLITSIPMCLLIMAQFYSPQSAFINRGIGGDISGGGFSGAMGYLRPPGTFSFISGSTSFFSICACFNIYFILNSGEINRVLLICSVLALLIAIPISISRTLLFQVIISALLTIVVIVKQKKYRTNILVAVILTLLLFILIQNFNFYNNAIDVFLVRLDRANTAEGGIESVFLDRYLGGLINAVLNSVNQPFFGYGLGYGSNVGSMLLTNSRTFLISEGEWGKTIGEMGPLLGLTTIALRITITIKLIKKALEFVSINETLPYILLTYGIFTIPQGSFSQPTSLGFIVVLGGIIIAAFNNIQVTGSDEEN